MTECQTFTDKSKRQVRVIYEQDGTPLFCGNDIAAAAGYKAPGKAVSQNRRKIEAVKCYVDWQNETKRGKVQTYSSTSVPIWKESENESLEERFLSLG